MAEEAMCQLMADVATLSVIMVSVVVNNDGLYSARHGHRRKMRLACSQEHGAVAWKITHSSDDDVEVITNSIDVQRVNRRKADFPANIHGDAVRLRLEPPFERQLCIPQRLIRRVYNLF